MDGRTKTRGYGNIASLFFLYENEVMTLIAERMYDIERRFADERKT